MTSSAPARFSCPHGKRRQGLAGRRNVKTRAQRARVSAARRKRAWTKEMSLAMNRLKLLRQDVVERLGGIGSGLGLSSEHAAKVLSGLRASGCEWVLDELFDLDPAPSWNFSDDVDAALMELEGSKGPGTFLARLPVVVAAFRLDLDGRLDAVEEGMARVVENHALMLGAVAGFSGFDLDEEGNLIPKDAGPALDWSAPDERMPSDAARAKDGGVAESSVMTDEDRGKSVAAPDGQTSTLTELPDDRVADMSTPADMPDCGMEDVLPEQADSAPAEAKPIPPVTLPELFRPVPLEAAKEAADKLTRDGTVWCGPLNRVAKGVELRGTIDPDAVADTLDAEFPWFASANAFVRRNLALRSLGGTGWPWLPPMLLKGDPGIGKTTWARRLGELLGVHSAVMGCAGVSESLGFSGSDRSFREAQPGFPFREVASSGCGNPLLVLDEIEKAGSSDQFGRLHDALLEVLEPSTARSVRDRYFDLPFDWSPVIWVLTANDASRLPEPLLSRVEEIDVPAPEPDEVRAVLPAIRRALCGTHSIPDDRLPALTEADVEAVLDGYGGHGSLRLVRKEVERVLSSKLAGKAAPVRKAADLRRTAVHEAGHAVVGAALGLEPVRASVEPDGSSHGRVSFRRPAGNPDVDRLKAGMAMLYAGWAAEVEAFGQGGTTPGVLGDFETAERQARTLVSMGASGLGPVPVSDGFDDAAKAEVARLMKEAADLAVKTVSERRDEIEALAARLAEAGTLGRSELGRAS